MRSVPDSWWIKWVWKGSTNTPLNALGARRIVEKEPKNRDRENGALPEIGEAIVVEKKAKSGNLKNSPLEEMESK
jgi:hypothetical protein